MAEETGDQPVVARMLRNRGQAEPDANADLGRDLARAAQVAIGLELRARISASGTASADDLLGKVDPDALLVALQDGAGGCGLAVLSRDLVAAMAEMQMTGQLAGAAAASRPMTRTDAALCEPVLAGFLATAGFPQGLAPKGRIASLRLARQLVNAKTLRQYEFDLGIGAGTRTGRLEILIPAEEPAAALSEPGDQGPDWAAALSQVVGASPARFQAVLHRFRMPLNAACAFEVGQILPLTGSGIGSVSVEAPNGLQVAKARLGQIAGRRAVRLEMPLPAAMGEVPIPAIETSAAK